MNIYGKLIEVRKSVPYLKKDNAGFQFKYVSSSQTLGALREAMDAQQLLLVPRVVKWEIRDHLTSKDKHEYFSVLDMEFTWVNAEKPEEIIVCPWVGCGLDDGEKGIGKAVTYAEKYFLLKFFNIATDKDDPDSFQKPTGGTEKKVLPPPPTQRAPFRDEIAPQESTNASQATGPYDDPEYNMRLDIQKWGMEIVAGNKDEYHALIESLTSFVDKTTKETVSGVSGVTKLKGTRLNITHSKMKKLFEDAQKKAGMTERALTDAANDDPKLPF